MHSPALSRCQFPTVALRFNTPPAKNPVDLFWDLMKNIFFMGKQKTHVSVGEGARAEEHHSWPWRLETVTREQQWSQSLQAKGTDSTEEAKGAMEQHCSYIQPQGAEEQSEVSFKMCAQSCVLLAIPRSCLVGWIDCSSCLYCNGFHWLYGEQCHSWKRSFSWLCMLGWLLSSFVSQNGHPVPNWEIARFIFVLRNFAYSEKWLR